MILRRYFGSMAGRLFILLLVGVFGSSTLALVMADARRQAELKEIRLEQVVDRLDSFLSLLGSASAPLRAELLDTGVPGIRHVSGLERIEGVDADLTRLLANRGGAIIRADRATALSCFAASPFSPSSPFYDPNFDCWVVSARLANGEVIRFQVRSPGADVAAPRALDPLFLLILTPAIAAFAFLSARMAAGPLRDLSRAAQTLGYDLDSQPLPERGSHEVREATRAFNAMQEQLRSYVVERTQMLASITHDLQTPMTRLRLRLEKVDDVALRSRLVDDLATMQALIREGLDYARSNQTNEPFATVALDQLLEVVVEDAVEAGAPIVFTGGCGCDVEVRPRALQRCLANLIDNALKYGGGAEVSAEWSGGEVEVRIRDRGPGIPPDQIPAVLKPFVRLEGSASTAAEGVGLGLTIAKSLAEKNEAELRLRNHPDGGLEASVILHRGIARTPQRVRTPRRQASKPIPRTRKTKT